MSEAKHGRLREVEATWWGDTRADTTTTTSAWNQTSADTDIFVIATDSRYLAPKFTCREMSERQKNQEEDGDVGFHGSDVLF